MTSTTLGFAVRTLESGVYSSSESTGIVVDNNNGVHVVHAAILAAPTLRGRVRHYYKATSQSTWTSRNIEVSNSSERPGLHFALARDKSAGLHLVYRSKDYRILRYATLAKVTDAWKISTMTTSLHYGWYIDLMVDSLGTLHTSFQYQLRGHLIYGVKKKSDFAWKFSTVTTQGTTGLFSSLVMNARGSLFISFYDASAADLLIAFLPNCP